MSALDATVRSRPTRRDCLLLIVIMACGMLAVSLQSRPVALAVTVVAITANGYLDLVPFVRWPLVRRPLRALPHFFPLPAFGIADRTTLPWLAVALILPVGYHVLYRRDVRLALDRTLGALFAPASWSSKVSEALFFLLPALGQEYLHRFVVLGLVVDARSAPIERTMGACLCAATFVLEHYLGPMRHTPRSPRNVVLWAALGVVFGLVVAFGDALVAVMVAHAVFNLPSALRPFARPTLRGVH